MAGWILSEANVDKSTFLSVLWPKSVKDEGDTLEKG